MVDLQISGVEGFLVVKNDKTALGASFANGSDVGDTHVSAILGSILIWRFLCSLPASMSSRLYLLVTQAREILRTT